MAFHAQIGSSEGEYYHSIFSATQVNNVCDVTMFVM